MRRRTSGTDTNPRGGVPQHVYFIQAERGGPVKIGVSRNPEARLRGLQGGYPEVLVIRRVIPGGPSLEGHLHRRFRDAHLRGEWFRPSDELEALMRSDEPVEDDGGRVKRLSRKEKRPGSRCANCHFDLYREYPDRPVADMPPLCRPCDEMAGFRRSGSDFNDPEFAWGAVAAARATRPQHMKPDQPLKAKACECAQPARDDDTCVFCGKWVPSELDLALAEWAAEPAD